MQKIPVVISHPLNKIAIENHGGNISPSVLLPGSEDHAAGYGNIYKITNSGPIITSPMFQPGNYKVTNSGPVITSPMFQSGASVQPKRKKTIRETFAGVFARKGNL